jgi:sugar lactone lactonase YvrE
MRAELLEDTQCLLGEGPRLFPDGSLWWVDLLAGRVFRRQGGGRSTHVASYPGEVSTALPWINGYLALTRRGVVAVSFQGDTVATIDLTEGDASMRCSDATVLPDGGIAVGVVDRDLTPGRGRLIVVHPDGGTTAVVDEATIPNGIGTTPDGSEVVWVDSPTHQLVRFTIDATTGCLTNRRNWVTLSPHLGVPDGLCIDREGGVWVAMWGGGRVIHVDATGHHDGTVDVPVDHVTSVAFDSDDTLIITTGNVALTTEQRGNTPGAGGLWGLPHHAHGTRGLPPRVSTLTPHHLPAHRDKTP